MDPADPDTPVAVDQRQVAAGEGGAQGARSKGLTPRGLFDEYICKRRPVVLKGAAQCEGSGCCAGIDPEWRGSQRWTDKHLKAVAGSDMVRVERRQSDAGGDGLSSATETHAPFGQGMYKHMTFGSFLDLLAQGDTNHYMTTQDPVEDASGQLKVIANPCQSLFRRGDFPLQPSLTGNLVPATINMWFGNSAGGSSSGLHHDFHDNLYVLLRGRKRFRLYSPADAHCMYTSGTVEFVHKNGLIRYRGGPETFADGSTATMRALAAASTRREKLSRISRWPSVMLLPESLGRKKDSSAQNWSWKMH